MARIPPIFGLFLVSTALTACGASDSGSPVAPVDAAPAADTATAPGPDATGPADAAIPPADAVPDADPSLVVEIGADPVGPVNRRLLGNNVQWTDASENLVDAEGRPRAPQVQALEAMGTSLLRYPGGTLSDAFHYADSLAPLESRPFGLDLSGNTRPQTLGLGEFLDLCVTVGVEPLFTLNLFAGTTEEAVQDALGWLDTVNGPTGLDHGWPRATYWEIGNEPYLTTQTPGYGDDRLTPEVFASRANAVLHALRAADATLRPIVPLRADTFAGRPTVTKPGYAATVLSQIVEPFDLVAIHDGYLPVDLDDAASDADLYLAAMAGPTALNEALDGYRTQLDAAFPGRNIGFALTEFHPWLSLKTLIALNNPAHTTDEVLDAIRIDNRANSVAGALYTADLVRMAAYRGDVELATFWSASGNYIFGAVSPEDVRRPPALALIALSQVLRGSLLPVTVGGTGAANPTFATPAVGFVHAFDAIPAVTALATRQDTAVRLLLMNKHPTDAVTVRLSGISPVGLNAGVLTADDPLANDDTQAWLDWKSLAVTNGHVVLPPHSLVRIDGVTQ